MPVSVRPGPGSSSGRRRSASSGRGGGVPTSCAGAPRAASPAVRHTAPAAASGVQEGWSSGSGAGAAPGRRPRRPSAAPTVGRRRRSRALRAGPAPAGRRRRGPGRRGRAGPRPGSSRRPPRSVSPSATSVATTESTASAAPQTGEPPTGGRPRGRAKQDATSTPTRTVRAASLPFGASRAAATAREPPVPTTSERPSTTRAAATSVSAASATDGERHPQGAQAVHACSVRPRAPAVGGRTRAGADRGARRRGRRFPVHRRRPAGLPGRDRDDRREHRRRHHHPRPAGLPRPGHADVHPRRRRATPSAAGAGSTRAGGRSRSCGRTAPSPPGSASATATSAPTSSAPSCSPPACPLSEVTARLCARWWAHDPGLRLLPMTDDPVETYVDIADADAPGGPPVGALPGVLGAPARRARGPRGHAGRHRGRPARPRRRGGPRRRRPGAGRARATRWCRSARSSPSPASATRCGRHPPRSSASPASCTAHPCSAWRTGCCRRSASRSTRPPSGGTTAPVRAAGVLDAWVVDTGDAALGRGARGRRPPDAGARPGHEQTPTRRPRSSAARSTRCWSREDAGDRASRTGPSWSSSGSAGIGEVAAGDDLVATGPRGRRRAAPTARCATATSWS